MATAKSADVQPFWEKNLILKVRSGSQAHGLATAESDYDSRGVCIPSKAYLLGLETFEQHESEGGDHVIYALVKFVRLALEGNPNLLETLFTEGDDILFLHPYGRRLVEQRELFLSQRVGERFGRYAIHQLTKLQRHYGWLTNPPDREPHPSDYGATPNEHGFDFPNASAERQYRGEHKRWRSYLTWRANRNKKRAILEQEFGYDTKHAMHLCRLLKMGQEILATGQVQVRRPDAEWLKEVRSGRFSYPELVEWAGEQEGRLAELMATTHLPPEPDRDRAEALVIELQEQALQAGFI